MAGREGTDNRRGHDHIGQYNFKVEIDGVTEAAFKAVDGLDSETEIIEYQDGDDMILRKRPGRTKYSNITCKRGYVTTTELWDWRKTVMDGGVQRKSGSIVLMNDKSEEVMRYNFFEAWPAKWKGFSLDGKGADVAVEEIEFVVEYWERVEGGG
jgi:phage tail-like protein